MFRFRTTRRVELRNTTLRVVRGFFTSLYQQGHGEIVQPVPVANAVACRGRERLAAFLTLPLCSSVPLRRLGQPLRPSQLAFRFHLAAQRLNHQWVLLECSVQFARQCPLRMVVEHREPGRQKFGFDHVGFGSESLRPWNLRPWILEAEPVTAGRTPVDFAGLQNLAMIDPETFDLVNRFQIVLLETCCRQRFVPIGFPLAATAIARHSNFDLHWRSVDLSFARLICLGLTAPIGRPWTVDPQTVKRPIRSVRRSALADRSDLRQIDPAVDFQFGSG